MNATAWQSWIDRGGTFTDVVARRPDGVIVTVKLLADDLEQYDDVAIEAFGVCSAYARTTCCPLRPSIA